MAKVNFKKGDTVNFLYVDDNKNYQYFEENVLISNSPYEKYLSSPKGQYYFLNPNGRIQNVHIPEEYVFPLSNKVAKVLYGRK